LFTFIYLQDGLLTESPKRKKTSLAAVNTVTVSTPNPNLVSAAVSVDTVVSEPTAPMDTAVLGQVTASGHVDPARKWLLR